METASVGIRGLEVQDISRKQVKEEIKAFVSSKSGELVYVDDIMEGLDLPFDLVSDICRELEREGEIKGVKLQYDIHTKVAALMKTTDADLLIRLVDLLFEKHYDPEPLSPREVKAIKEGEEEIKRGDFITLEDLKKELGL